MSEKILVGPIRVRIIQEKKRLFRKPEKKYIHLELEVTADDGVKTRKVEGDIEEVHAYVKRGFHVSGTGINITNLDLSDYVITGNYSPHSGPLDIWVRNLGETQA